jgi:serine/threonine-protein kinase
MTKIALLQADWWLVTGWKLVLLGAASLLLLFLLARLIRPLLPGGKAAATESPETSRLLGLALQGQGKLDQAFAKFRLCPVTEGLLENLYHLALAYERQRQFESAAQVFRHIAGHDPDFRDVARRLDRTAAAPLASIPPELPQLGRYQLARPLGKGAMGIVYQGVDPDSQCLVAIKTLALTQSFEPDQLAEVKQRFFAEAEMAGRLSHPNIVRIFDAGEAAGLAYLVMEFLRGDDLVAHSKPGALLPLPTVLSIVARVADALDYAHRQQVVHRDIKPANIMYDPALDQVKVMDFGIARLTDSTRTRAGVVLGTPSCMSPEQLLGRKIDGRSDIYALGVTLYQLCCGQPPFRAESLSRLMSAIVNDKAPDILVLNPDLPPQVVAIIARAMAKDAAQRYPRAAHMAADLRACLMPANQEMAS